MTMKKKERKLFQLGGGFCTQQSHFAKGYENKSFDEECHEKP